MDAVQWEKQQWIDGKALFSTLCPDYSPHAAFNSSDPDPSLYQLLLIWTDHSNSIPHPMSQITSWFSQATQVKLQLQ